ncbi:hypothetical protein Q3A80_02195 [Burkholderia sp. SR8]|uniref:hypothetical protein n=1 Tax=Burkholderia sp. SR8 TaxID=3062277 RepID=UPI00406428FD
MADSTTNIDQISSTQANKELTMNSLVDAGSPSMMWGRRASASGGLTWGYYGGRFVDNTGTPHAIANGTITLGASTTTYVMANPTTGAVTSNTTGFTAGLVPLYSIVTGASTVTSYLDYRSYQPSAVAAAAASGVGLAGGAIQTAAYTFVSGDKGQCLVMNSASAVSQALPSPGGTGFGNQWWASAENIGAGTMTLTVPTGVKLDGVTNGTLALPTNAGITFFTNGTDYFSIRGLATGGGMTNPMTTAGDIIIGGASGAPARLGIGSNGQVLTVASGAPAWVTPSGASAPATASMDLVSYFVGAMGASQVILNAITPQPLTLPASLTGSYAYCDTAPTNAVTCTINQVNSSGTATAIGSVNFAAGSKTGTFTFSSAVTTNAGDRVQVVAPSTVDSTFAGPTIGLAGTTPVNAGTVAVQTAAYTFQPTDRNALNVMNSASATSSALPTATGTSGNYPNGWRTSFSNIGAGTATLTVPSGASLDGVTNGTLALTQNQGVTVWTDGTNWFTTRGTGGGSGSGAAPADGTADTPPVLSSFSWLNQGSTAQASQQSGFISMSDTTTAAQLRALVKAPPVTPYKITIRMRGILLGNYQGYGLIFYDSTSGKVISFGTLGTSLQVYQWNSPSSGSGAAYNSSMAFPPQWLRIRDDGTNLYADISTDGVSFLNVWSASRTAYLSTPNQIGFYMLPNAQPMQASLHSWLQS